MCCLLVFAFVSLGWGYCCCFRCLFAYDCYRVDWFCFLFVAVCWVLLLCVFYYFHVRCVCCCRFVFLLCRVLVCVAVYVLLCMRLFRWLVNVLCRCRCLFFCLFVWWGGVFGSGVSVACVYL